MFRATSFALCLVVAAFASVQEAEMFSYPWLAGIGSVDSNLFSCTGVLVHKHWVLTAAHCDLKLGGAVHLHRHDMYDYAENGAEVARISTIIRHPDFKKDTLENDIALVGFCSDCSVPPVKIANETFIGESSVFLTAGWGKLSVEENKIVKKLHQMKVEAMDNKACRDSNHYGRAGVDNVVSSANICTKRDGSGFSCQMDAGTPLFEGNTVYGINTWAVGCGDENNPGVFTKVSSFADWIRSTVTTTKISSCDKKHRRTQQDFTCGSASSCGACAGQSFVDASGTQKWCYWCAASNACVDDTAWSTLSCAGEWAFQGSECTGGATAGTTTGTNTVGTNTVGTNAAAVSDGDETPSPLPTVVEIAVATEAVSTLVSVLTMPEYKGILDALSGAGPFTVFAPTNDAFAAAGVDVTDVETVSAVLTYHVLSGAVFSTDLAESQDVATLNGATVSVLKSDGVTVNGANVVVADVAASNGVVHVIDAVLLPPAPEAPPAVDMNRPVTVSTSTESTTTDEVFKPSNADAAKCAFSRCGECAGRAYTDSEGNAAQCYWCDAQKKCISQAAWETNEVCEKYAFDSNSVGCAVSAAEDRCANAAKSCSTCTDASYTDEFGVFNRCVWCGNSCLNEAKATAESCRAPVSSCTVSGSSTRTCAQLGWASAPGSDVCASSTISGKCSYSLEYEFAEAWCRDNGARLCSAEELKNDVALGSGCKLDKERVWSSTQCEGGAHSLSGSTAGKEAEKCTAKSENLRVRCCADQPSGSGIAPLAPKPKTCAELAWPTEPSSPFVCAKSEFPGGVCAVSSTFASAQAACLGLGARLCTSAELSADDAKGSGCKLDEKIVWSSTSCAGGQIAQRGSFAEGMTPACLPVADRAGVRCCADAPSSDGVHTCEELGWSPLKIVSGKGICAESKVNGQCSGAVTASDAAAYCAAAGSRVCSAAELTADAAKGSGCKLDGERVWSSTACDGGFQTTGGSSGSAGTQCSSPDAQFKVRCCAESTGIVMGARG